MSKALLVKMTQHINGIYGKHFNISAERSKFFVKAWVSTRFQFHEPW